MNFSFPFFETGPRTRYAAEAALELPILLPLSPKVPTLGSMEFSKECSGAQGGLLLDKALAVQT